MTSGRACLISSHVAYFFLAWPVRLAVGGRRKSLQEALELRLL